MPAWRRSVRFTLHCIAAAGLLVGLAHAAPTQTLVPVPGRPAAPDLRLEAADGAALRLSTLKGRVVVVNFWASWCPPCRREMPSLERLNRIMHGERFAIVGIDAGEEMEDVLGFQAALDPAPAFGLYLDRDGKALEAFGVKGLPTTFVLDPEGRVAYKALGARAFDDPAIVAVVRALMPAAAPNTAR